MVLTNKRNLLREKLANFFMKKYDEKKAKAMTQLATDLLYLLANYELEEAKQLALSNLKGNDLDVYK